VLWLGFKKGWTSWCIIYYLLLLLYSYFSTAVSFIKLIGGVVCCGVTVCNSELTSE
jgi:hypothetical protein